MSPKPLLGPRVLVILPLLWVWLPVLKASSDAVQLCNLGSGCCEKCWERSARSNAGAPCFAWELQVRSGRGSLNYRAAVPVLGHLLC